MPALVVDTHTIVWYLAGDNRLSRSANEALDAATRAGESIYVPAICLVELTYLVEKGRLPDRIIAATALALGVPVIGRDARIRASQVPCIW